MKKPVAWLAGALGIAGLWRLLRRRRIKAPAAEVSPADDPADALRAKLAETREAEPEPEPTPEPASLEERRRAVHDAGRAAIDEMRSPDGAEGSPGPGSK